MSKATLKNVAEFEGMYVADRVPVASCRRPHPDDRRTPSYRRPLTQLSHRSVRVYGVDEASLIFTRRDSLFTAPHGLGYASSEFKYMLSSLKPFVAVGFTDDNNDPSYGRWATCHRRLFVPRQINKGEFGQRAPFDGEPRILPSDMLDPTTLLDHPRELNWVGLDELAALTGLKPATILREFAGFSLSTWYEPNVVVRDPNGKLWRVYSDMLQGSYHSGELQWGGEDAAVLLDEQYSELLNRRPRGYAVTQTFAFAVLRLVQYGYQCGDGLPQGGVLLEVPMRDVPTVDEPLPVLSGEELRELHPLSVSRPTALSEAAFCQVAEAAMGYADWTQRTTEDSLLEDLGSRFSIRRLSGFGERLVVARVYLTHGHASDARPHQCSGMLVVLPDGSQDVASAILRLWFTPDGVHRMTPEGSKGGLCPPEVPSDIAPVVKRFLLDLGYDV
ncbi:MAG TPA: hypothetical protein VLG40_01490 [Candidatus Saccharimonas sp.]|nr:hypothetical protein [Candidatus Saccharimonas sp.]